MKSLKIEHSLLIKSLAEIEGLFNIMRIIHFRQDFAH